MKAMVRLGGSGSLNYGWMMEMSEHIGPVYHHGCFVRLSHFLMQLAPALGGFALATQLAGMLYDRQAAAQGDSSACKGSLCFRQGRSPHCVVACTDVAGTHETSLTCRSSVHCAAANPLGPVSTNGLPLQWV